MSMLDKLIKTSKDTISLEGKTMEELKGIVGLYNAMEKSAADAEDAIYHKIEALKKKYEKQLAKLEKQQEAAYKYKTEVVWEAPEQTQHWDAWHEIERRDWLNGKWMGKKGGSIHFVKDNNVPEEHIFPRQEVICRTITSDKLSEGQGNRVCQFCLNMTEHIRTRKQGSYEVPEHSS